jgi:hypothetical protein
VRVQNEGASLMSRGINVVAAGERPTIVLTCPSEVDARFGAYVLLRVGPPDPPSSVCVLLSLLGLSLLGIARALCTEGVCKAMERFTCV